MIQRLAGLISLIICMRMKQCNASVVGFKSGQILKDAIGASDGQLIRIVRPSTTRDGVQNTVASHSRKGFYALNFQVIVDDREKVLWLGYSNKGCSYDSGCFRSSGCYGKLKEMANSLYDKKSSYLTTLFTVLSLSCYRHMTHPFLKHPKTTSISTTLVQGSQQSALLGRQTCVGVFLEETYLQSKQCSNNY